MMTIVIPINADTSISGERLCDWLRTLNGQSGHALLAYDPDVHAEMRTRIRIAADLAFLSVDEVIAPQKDTPEKPASATFKRNTLFLTAAEFCQKTYRGSWLLLDPISVPTNPEWLKNIEAAYDAQPRRYMGTHLRPESRYLFHTSVYPFNAFYDMSRIVSELPEAPFEIACGATIIPRSTKWRLVQPLKILAEDDFEKVWPEAQVVCGDAGGAYIEFLREKWNQPPSTPERFVVDPYAGGCVKYNPVIHGAPSEENPAYTTPKIDRRTKAGRALKAAEKATI